VQAQRFTTTLAADVHGRAFVDVPFDPDEVWSPKLRHRVTGTINGRGIRAVIEIHAEKHGFIVGPAWLRECHGGVAIGDVITVEIVPEGPQRNDLADDIAAALVANPEAGAFFDSLAQFYRKAYLRWIDATKRRPDERALRIAEVIQLLKAGIKERPKS
jgi:hypothetical protein